MKKNQGFTLIISIVVTSMMLIISFAVVNIAVRQLVISSSNEQSQIAFYNADSGIECAVYWDFRNGTTAFATATTATITCNNQTILNMGGGGSSNATSTFTLNLTKGCVTVSVGKHNHGVTIIDSRGYNTCSPGEIRKLERATRLGYENAN